MSASVVAVHLSPTHAFSKIACDSITLVQNRGVLGDAHFGETVKHRSRVNREVVLPNLRQVHLIHLELINSLQAQGFRVDPGVMGENITTRGLDLLGLPTGSQLVFGSGAVVELTGLRNPCAQLDNHQKGLAAAVLDRDEDGNLVRLAGVMGIVIAGGEIQPEDEVSVNLPERPHEPLEPV